MSILQASNNLNLGLSPGERLTVIADSASSGSVLQLGDKPGETTQGRTSISNGTLGLGPYGSPKRFQLQCDDGVLSYSLSRPDLLASDAALTLAQIKTNILEDASFLTDLGAALGVGT